MGSRKRNSHESMPQGPRPGCTHVWEDRAFTQEESKTPLEVNVGILMLCRDLEGGCRLLGTRRIFKQVQFSGFSTDPEKKEKRVLCFCRTWSLKVGLNVLLKITLETLWRSCYMTGL